MTKFINFNDSYVKYLETEKASAKPDLNIQPVVKDMASAIVNCRYAEVSLCLVSPGNLEVLYIDKSVQL